MKRQDSNAPLYKVIGVVKEYGGRPVLHVDRLAIEKKCILGLVGPNGSGKSTLLRILAFLEETTQGTVFFEGRPCTPRHDNVRKRVTLLCQEPYLLKRSVMANVAYGLRVRGETRIAEKVDKALDMVGLAPEIFARRPWDALSAGEAQRVALATRLVVCPRVLLLDEPTTSLDVESAERIKEASIGARRDWGATLIIASHDTVWLESICDDIIGLVDGRLKKA